ncbi:MAG: hypothetical protein M3237_09495 [Actinomycetota bacterium]|nr:hypothetical protein [Actinomycetota bacterium]
MSRRAQRALRILALPIVVGVLAGCGSDEPPSAAAPELADALSAVDDALANRNFARAEKALDRLTTEAEEAEQAGEISETEADEIVDAAEDLVALLPHNRDVDPLDDATTPAPAETPPPEDEGEEDDEEKGKDDKEDKDEEKNGNGHNSDNGPDDGHGNGD